MFKLENGTTLAVTSEQLMNDEQCNRYADAVERILAQKFPAPFTAIKQQLYGSCNVGEKTFDNILREIQPTVEDIVGMKLLPCYSYAIIYETGQNIAPHTDRAAAEWTVSVPVRVHENKLIKFPLYVEDREINLAIGEGAIFKGHTYSHWRHKYEGVSHMQALFHYVKADGYYTAFANKLGQLTVADQEFVAFQKVMNGEDPDGTYSAFLKEQRTEDNYK